MLWHVVDVAACCGYLNVKGVKRPEVFKSCEGHIMPKHAAPNCLHTSTGFGFVLWRRSPNKSLRQLRTAMRHHPKNHSRYQFVNHNCKTVRFWQLALGRGDENKILIPSHLFAIHVGIEYLNHWSLGFVAENTNCFPNLFPTGVANLQRLLTIQDNLDRFGNAETETTIYKEDMVCTMAGYCEPFMSLPLPSGAW